jgi:hypothetical protein
MKRLINAYAPSSRQSQLHQQTPGLPLNAAAPDLQRLHPAHELIDIITHQVKLVHVVSFRGMNGNFGGRQPEYEPSTARIDTWEPQHIADEVTVFFRLRTIDD